MCYRDVIDIFPSMLGSLLGCQEHEEVSAGQCVVTKHRVWVWWTRGSFYSDQEHPEEPQLWPAIVFLWCGKFCDKCVSMDSKCVLVLITCWAIEIAIKTTLVAAITPWW